MRVPYSIQGALFAPALIGVMFFLQVSCPESVGGGCFSDYLSAPLFLPAVFMHGVWGGAQILIQYELLLIMLYWMLVGFLLGLCFDTYKRDSN